MKHDREIPVGVLTSHGLTEQEAKLWTGGAPTIKWVDVARRDGLLALTVLTPSEFSAIRLRLVEAGLPPTAGTTPAEIVEIVFAHARSIAPHDIWYDHALTSSVACATLLRLAQEASGYTDEQIREAELQTFGSQLGANETPKIILPH